MPDGTRRPIRPKVLAYMVDRPNQTLHLDTMASDLGFTAPQVQACINHMRKEPPAELDLAASITVIRRGSVWKFKPVNPPINQPETSLLYTQIGVTKDGSHVLQCEDGTLWKATEL